MDRKLTTHVVMNNIVLKSKMGIVWQVIIIILVSLEYLNGCASPPPQIPHIAINTERPPQTARMILDCKIKNPWFNSAWILDSQVVSTVNSQRNEKFGFAGTFYGFTRDQLPLATKEKPVTGELLARLAALYALSTKPYALPFEGVTCGVSTNQAFVTVEGQLLGSLNKDGTLTWDRTPGKAAITGLLFDSVGITVIQNHDLTAEPGRTYHMTLSYAPWRNTADKAYAIKVDRVE